MGSSRWKSDCYPYRSKNNLPLLKDFVCSDEEKNNFSFHGLNAYPEFEEIQPCAVEEDGIDPIDYERACAIKCFSSVADATNQNLTSAQKELLFWHKKLCLNMQDLQQLMKPQLIRDQEMEIWSPSGLQSFQLCINLLQI